MEDFVSITGHLPLAEFEQYIVNTDIALNMRERTVGETSASLCRILAGGVCSIVADVGWYAELPDDSVVKVGLDLNTDALLAAYLQRLIEDEKLRRRIGENARRYALAEHQIERSANLYLDVINSAIAQRRGDGWWLLFHRNSRLRRNSPDGFCAALPEIALTL